MNGLYLVLLVISLAIFGHKPQQIPPATIIQGVILPHHDLAKDILNNSFSRLKENINPDVIVIYGTNHYFPISETYTTTTQIKTDYALANVLADDARIEGDHSIQTILLYVSQYFPNSKVVPILVSTKYQSLNDLKKNVNTITNAIHSQNTLYIASVDFAHNVSLEEGLNHNNESIANISNFNYGNILNYHDDHLDSPIAITAFLLTMENLNARSWQLWYSSHGALITNFPNLEGTSYVVGSFEKLN